MLRIYRFTCLLLCFVLISCTSSIPTPTQITNPLPTSLPPTQTITPTITTLPPTQAIIPAITTLPPTQVITPTSSIIPPTQVITPATNIISPENAHDLVPLVYRHKDGTLADISMQKDMSSFITSVAFSPNGDILAVEYQEGSLIDLYNVATGELQGTLKTNPGYNGMIYPMAFSPDSKLLVVGGGWPNNKDEGGVQVWDMATLEMIKMLDTGEMVRDVAFIPNSSILAIASGDAGWVCAPGSIKLWDVTSGELVSEIALEGKEPPGAWWWNADIASSDTVVGVSFNPDGSLMAGINCSGNAGIWKVDDQTRMTTMAGAESWGYAVAFSPDGKLLATTGSTINNEPDCNLRLWEVSTGELLFTLDNCTWWADTLSFSPDGRLLATGAQLWDVETGQSLVELDKYIIADAFSPDGTLLATGLSWVYLWAVPKP